MTWPTVAIVLLTYDRISYARRTLETALVNISYSGLLHVHIADDGSPEGYVEKLVHLSNTLMSAQPTSSLTTVTNSERRGYGASYNMATQVVHQLAEVILPLEDDWVLTRPLELDPLVAALMDEATPFDCIRLGYVGYTQPLRGEFCYVSGAHYLRLDPSSPEPHVFAGHPRLETRARQRRVGPWAEGLDPGATEFEVAMRPEAREGVAWPLDLISPNGGLFAHIGTVSLRSDRMEPASVS